MFAVNSKLLVLGFLIAVYATASCGAESSTCLTVYKKGGAPAVFRSPKCPLWELPNYDIRSRTSSTNAAGGSLCQSAMLQGRRKFQEDRTFCALDILIPFPGKTGLKEVMVGIVAVFDGHNGAEASEMASKLLLEYFALHTYFLLDATYSLVLKESAGRLLSMKGKDSVFQLLNWDEELGRHELNFDRSNFFVPEKFDDSFHLRVLKEALVRAIHDIDATFSMEASRKNLDSGSTATIVLIADGHILVANVGDSKALVCSEKFQSPAEARATLLRLYRERRRSGAVLPVRYRDNIKLTTSNGLAHFIVEELTRDHHPDRDDEKFRVETAGGYVHDWGGVARVNGQLAVSRAIGDVHYKRYGVISAPEVTDWQPVSKNDTYLVVASDGMFEKLSLQDVCDILWEVHSHGTERSKLSSSCSHSLAECLVNTAFERGSSDNVATVVVPLGSIGIPQRLVRERCIGEDDIHCSSIGLKKPTHGLLDNDITTSELVQLTHGHPLISKLDRLLVEGKHGNFGCYYLSENLNDANTIQDRTNNKESYLYDLPQALPEAFNHQYDGPLNLYTDLNLCWHFGTTVGGAKDQCPNPDGLANFLGLLESIPFLDDGSNYGSNDYATPDLRYVLKKRFGRGSYGEVWLGFYWNCHQDCNASSCTGTNGNFTFNKCSNQNRSKSAHSTSHECNADSNDDMFVLKRIMVERGASVYLSGLREKYFGEVFLNASRCLGGFLVDGITKSPVEEFKSDFEETIDINDSVHGLGNSWLPQRFRIQRPAFEEGLNHIARYVESFESQSNEIWLVFHHEGLSLSKIMYSVESAQEKMEDVKHVQVLHPSKWWHWLKTTEAGNKELRNLIWQLLIALKSCHERNITHRDIKPENMVICFEDQDSGRCLKGVPDGHKNYTTKMRIIDFGSGMDEFTLKHFYGSTGPSRAEQTYEYAPPEAILNASWYQGPPGLNLKYDMWSVGVVILELVLGSPNVFQVGSLTRALLDPHIEGWNEDLKELAYKLRSFMELCILIPGSSSKHHQTTVGEGGASPASWRCSEEFFLQQIKSRDPLKLGFPNVWALRLVRQLLLWNPEDRLSVDDALQHPYFQHPPRR